VPTPSEQSRNILSYRGAELTLEGPRCLQVEICRVKIVHSFYALDKATPLVAGYDLITAARLISDPVNNCAYSYVTSCVSPQPPLARDRPHITSSLSAVKSSISLVADVTSYTPLCQGYNDLPIPGNSNPLCLDEPTCHPSLPHH